ncbi:MAG TPA: hypothetical protein VER03_09660 [Bryobacteraceae bacterium]|nr:hypothetical protein [Bryobacteraceae bacterium]
MLYLLRDQRGNALVIVQAANKAEANEYGRAHFPDFSGESLELDSDSRARAEEFQGLRTVQAAGGESGSTAVKAKKARAGSKSPAFTMTQVLVLGLEYPEGLIEDDVLTPEDRRDLALDHIARTSKFVGHIEIRKWARL